MADPKPNPIRPTDDTARALARDLLNQARFGALGVLDPESGAPLVTRMACCAIDGDPHILVSDLSAHTAALRADPRASLLIGEPGAKGDPLTHPRLTLQCRAAPTDKPALRAPWLALYPKAKLYIDFADFHFYRLEVVTGFLNGGFGKAFRLLPGDLTP